MASRDRIVTRRPPRASAIAGINAAVAALKADAPPLPEDLQAQIRRELALVPYRRRQPELALPLPDQAPR